MLGAEPNQRAQRAARKRRQLIACAYCGANGAACDSLLWLRKRACCEACPGDHDHDTEGQPDE